MTAAIGFASFDNPIRVQCAPVFDRLRSTFNGFAIDVIGMVCLPLAALTGHYAAPIYLAQPSSTFDSVIRIANSLNGEYHDIFMTDQELVIIRNMPEQHAAERIFCNPYAIESVKLSADLKALEFQGYNYETIRVGQGLEVAELVTAARAVNETLKAWKDYKFETRLSKPSIEN
jgi:hypothetical protein